jgi:hypothetical protein
MATDRARPWINRLQHVSLPVRGDAGWLAEKVQLRVADGVPDARPGEHRRAGDLLETERRAVELARDR